MSLRKRNGIIISWACVHTDRESPFPKPSASVLCVHKAEILRWHQSCQKKVCLSYLRCSSKKGIENKRIDSEDSVVKIPTFLTSLFISQCLVALRWRDLFLCSHRLCGTIAPLFRRMIEGALYHMRGVILGNQV